MQCESCHGAGGNYAKLFVMKDREVAKALGLKGSKVTLVSGETGREKRLHIAADVEPDWSRLSPFPTPE